MFAGASDHAAGSHLVGSVGDAARDSGNGLTDADGAGSRGRDHEHPATGIPSRFSPDTGEYMLILQGTRLVGLYDHHVVYGQQRVLITWKRLILPNGSSLSLSNGMPGIDAVGAAGFHDLVNNHYIRMFGNAVLLSLISAGVQLSQVPEFGQNFRGPTAGNVLGAAVRQQFGSTVSEFIRRGMSLAPMLDVRPRFPFNVMVTQDIVFPGPYQEATSP